MLRTQGDKVLDTPLPLLGGKGLFTAELEEAFARRRHRPGGAQPEGSAHGEVTPGLWLGPFRSEHMCAMCW